MTYTEHIKRGLKLVNSNWHLIVIQLVITIINIIVMGLMALFIAVIFMGALGLEGLSGNFDKLLSSPDLITQKITQVIWVLPLGAFLFILYLLFAFWLVAFTYAGTVGVLASAARDASYRFKLRAFIDEGKKLFWPIVRYMLYIILIMISILIILGLCTFITALMYKALGVDGTRFGIFIKVFLYLGGGSMALVTFMAWFALSQQAVAVLVVKPSERISVVTAFKDAWNFLAHSKEGFWLLCIVVGLFTAITLVLEGVGFGIQKIPLMGLFVYIPYQFFRNILGVYLNIATNAIIIKAYVDMSNKETTSISLNVPPSTSGLSTSPERAPLEVPPPFYPESWK